MKKNIKHFFLYHLSSYPDMQIQDIYKFVFQGVMGSGHAIQNEAAALEMFQRELSNFDKQGTAEETTELLSDEFIRVNLRPYIKNGGNPDTLFRAFIRTGYNHGGSEANLAPVWDAIKGLQTIFRQDDMDAYFAIQKKSGFPAVHHSEIYRELYRPSYRVVSVKEF